MGTLPTASCFNHQTVLQVTVVPHFPTGSWGVPRVTSYTKECQLVRSRTSPQSRKATSRATLVPTPAIPAVREMKSPGTHLVRLAALTPLSLSSFGMEGWMTEGILFPVISVTGVCMSLQLLFPALLSTFHHRARQAPSGLSDGAKQKGNVLFSVWWHRGWG